MKEEPKYAVKINTITNPVLHKYPCSQTRKRGKKGNYNQVIWKDFSDFGEALCFVERTETESCEKTETEGKEGISL